MAKKHMHPYPAQMPFEGRCRTAWGQKKIALLLLFSVFAVFGVPIIVAAASR